MRAETHVLGCHLVQQQAHLECQMWYYIKPREQVCRCQEHEHQVCSADTSLSGMLVVESILVSGSLICNERGQHVRHNAPRPDCIDAYMMWRQSQRHAPVRRTTDAGGQVCNGISGHMFILLDSLMRYGLERIGSPAGCQVSSCSQIISMQCA